MSETGLGKVVLFLPAYHAERTLEVTYAKVPKQCIDDALVVDDASGDNIEPVARKLGIHFYRNSRNLGYGGNIKVCIERALAMGADVLIELHPDDQYDPSAIPAALRKFREGAEFVMGSRFLEPGAARANRMPLWKYGINRASTYFLMMALRVRLSEFHCGFRVYGRRFLEGVNYQQNDDDYLFSFQIIAQAVAGKFKIAEVPVACRYYPGVTQINFRRSMRYGIGVLKTLARLRAT
jgi:glycosyltransferase involved in cell wall biosynthesis